MKTGERFTQHGDKVIHHRRFDNDPYIEEAERLRKSGAGQSGESRLVGRIPMHMVGEWVKEAGVQWSDREAVRDIIRRKMLSGDFDKFRVWKGRY